MTRSKSFKLLVLLAVLLMTLVFVLPACSKKASNQSSTGAARTDTTGMGTRYGTGQGGAGAGGPAGTYGDTTRTHRTPGTTGGTGNRGGR